MSWGYKIASAYIIFVIGICFLVYKTTQVKADLVTPNYYEQELKYQDKLDEAKRSADLSEPITFSVNNEVLSVKFPKDFAGKTKAGTVLLYCPSDKDKDMSKDISTTDDVVNIPLPKSANRFYEVQVSYKVNGVAYYAEQKLTLK